MKFIHLGDLHIGKRVNEFSMINDQREILKQIIKVSKSEKINGIFIAGDIYDKTIPSIEAIELFEDFICKIADLKIPAYIVSGNHDSSERLSTFSKLISLSGIHFSRNYDGKIIPLPLGNIDIWLLPFVRPADVRRFFPDIEIGNYQDAIENVVKNLDIDTSRTNILIAHQFVTANGKTPEISDSETSSLGTLDNIDYRIFDNFDYVALGHIHKPQSMGRKEIRYCGSPLKYSFSEVNQNKSITIVEIEDKKIDIKSIPFKPIHEMKEIRGKINNLLKMEKDESYMHITLTDTDVIDAKNKLETIFPNIMKLDFEEYYTNLGEKRDLKTLKEKTIFEHFSDFFEKQTKEKLTNEEKEIVSSILLDIKEAK